MRSDWGLLLSEVLGERLRERVPISSILASGNT